MTTDDLDRRLRHAVKLEATVTTGDGDCRPTQVANLSLDGSCLSGLGSDHNSVVADRRGAAAIEYCIAAAFIAMALIVALAGLGRGVESNFNNVDSAVGNGMQYQAG